jgi:hypothetical protein
VSISVETPAARPESPPVVAEPEAAPDATDAQVGTAVTNANLTNRDERLASAVRLTGEAIQAWAAVLGDRHDLASVPAPVTR